jgi:hypothetical protein
MYVRELNNNNVDYILLKESIACYALDSRYCDNLAYDISISNANGSDEELLMNVYTEIKRFAEYINNPKRQNSGYLPFLIRLCYNFHN